MAKLYGIELANDPYKDKELLPSSKNMLDYDTCYFGGCHMCPLGISNSPVEVFDGEPITKTNCLATTISRHTYLNYFSNFKYKGVSFIKNLLLKEYIMQFSKPNYEHEEMEI